MIFYIVSIIVPAALYFLAPVILQKMGFKKPAPNKLLLACCLLFGVSYYLPSPQIDGMETSFVTHFVGGGVFCALFWQYIKAKAGFTPSAFADAVFLYFLVSGLGVANELFEFGLYKTSLPTGLDPRDTWWDLLANTSGALAGWLVTRLWFARRSAANK